jgi:hypothetical protein
VIASSVTGADVAAIVAAAAAAVVLVVMVFALASLTRTVRALQTTVDELRSSTVPLMTDARSAVAKATAELERVDGVIGTAESIGSTVDSFSRLMYLAFSNPIIKALAFGSGTARAVRRFRRTSGPDD